MAMIKYRNNMEGGMPIHFPIGCKNKGGITHHKVANPYLELTEEEAEQLVTLDPHNFEIADEKEHAEWLESGKVSKEKGPSENQIAKEKKAEAKTAKKSGKK